MIRDRETEAQELTAEQLDQVSGGASPLDDHED